MKLIRKGFIGVLAAFMVSAVTPLLIPFALDGDGNLNGAGYAAGVMFWAGLIAGCVGYALLYRKGKQNLPKRIQNERKPATVKFFSSRGARISDVLLIISLAVTIYCMVNINANQTIAAVFLFLLLAAVYLHFLLNGKIYHYIEKSLLITKEGEKQNGKA